MQNWTCECWGGAEPLRVMKYNGHVHRHSPSYTCSPPQIMVKLILGVSRGHCWCPARGRGALLRMLWLTSPAVRTKPSTVLAERKLLMRLDGVCRHYLAMTKSALFLFADGGKPNTGTLTRSLGDRTPRAWRFLCIAPRLLFVCLCVLCWEVSTLRIRELKVAAALYARLRGLDRCSAPLTHFQDVARTGRRTPTVRKS